jgi:hypothetical protein
MTARIFERMNAPARAAGASPLLAFIAGEFAEAIADVWRAPHTDFLALPAARRHAVAILLSRAASREMGSMALRKLVEFARDGVVAAEIAGENATGLMRSLAKGGETLWRREDYERFLQLFADPMANEVLRHMEVVRPAAFEPLAALPGPLRIAPIVRELPSAAAARDLAMAFDLVVRMRSPEAAVRIAASWGSGGTLHQLFGRAIDDLTPDAFRGPDPAPKLSVEFVRVESRKALNAVALDFRNCLAEHAGRIAEGRMAVFVWKAYPAAVMALNWDVAGWRLAEVKRADNQEVDESQLRVLVAMLKAVGVRTGPSVQALRTRLEDHAQGTTYAYQPGPGFIEQLVLGDLWS